MDGEKYAAEVNWNANDLGLIPGHNYRLQFMVHDGDQNKTGGDVGESCTTIRFPDENCIPISLPYTENPDTNKLCYSGTVNNYVKASQEWTYDTNTDAYTIRTTFSKNFVDNRICNRYFHAKVHHHLESAGQDESVVRTK